MLETMLESNRPRRRALGQATVSLLLHAAVVTGVVSATMARPVEDHSGPVARNVTYVAPVQKVPPASRVEQPLISEAPSLPTFEALEAPVSIPTSIPPVDLMEPFDASRYTGIGREVPGPVLIVDSASGSGTSATWLAAEVDVAATRVSGGDPRYPVILRAAGVEGRVLAEFVVDAAGRVEPESWRVLEVTQPAFAEAAREAVLQWRFSPAKVRGRAVRQVVRLPVSFSLGATSPLD